MSSYIQNKIKVKKVSQLDDYIDYEENNNLSLTNSYLLIGYPDESNDMPHNYSLSITNLNDIMQETVDIKIAEIKKLFDEFSNELIEFKKAIKAIKICQKHIEFDVDVNDEEETILVFEEPTTIYNVEYTVAYIDEDKTSYYTTDQLLYAFSYDGITWSEYTDYDTLYSNNFNADKLYFKIKASGYVYSFDIDENEYLQKLSYYWNLLEEEIEEFNDYIAPWCADKETIEFIENTWQGLIDDYENIIN